MKYRVTEYWLDCQRFDYLPVTKSTEDNEWVGPEFNSIDECRDFLIEYKNERIKELQDEIDYLNNLPRLPVHEMDLEN